MIETTDALMQRGFGLVRRHLSRLLPSHLFFNYCLALPRFHNGNGRLPRFVEDPQATLNDIIFHRMIRNEWSVLHQTCVDKEYAKELAVAKAPGVKVPLTESVFHLERETSVAEVAEWMTPFIGHKLVVKPTHSFGAILFLDQTISLRQLAGFVRYAKRNFFHARRESQYRNLEKKLIIEQNLSPDQHVHDYKFSCSDGHVLHGRLDVGRGTAAHRRALFTVPDFEIIPVRTGGLDFPTEIERPARLDEMIEIAGQLSRGFDYVRVDLYDTPRGVYFGEFTFTPAAGACGYSDETIAIEMARRLKRLTPRSLGRQRWSLSEQLTQHGIQSLATRSGREEAIVPQLKKSAALETP